MGQVKWTTPPDGIWKLFWQATTFFGGIIGDNIGQWYGGYSGSCGLSTNLKAELFAILQGMQLAWKMRIINLICETDSQHQLILSKPMFLLTLIMPLSPELGFSFISNGTFQFLMFIEKQTSVLFG